MDIMKANSSSRQQLGCNLVSLSGKIASDRMDGHIDERDMCLLVNQMEYLLEHGSFVLIKMGDLLIDPNHPDRVYHVGRQERIKLRPKEFETLVIMARSEGVTMRREVLFATVWGNSPSGENVVGVTIHSLREKLNPDNRNEYIQTVRGYGYCLAPEVVPSNSQAD